MSGATSVLADPVFDDVGQAVLLLKSSANVCQIVLLDARSFFVFSCFLFSSFFLEDGIVGLGSSN